MTAVIGTSEARPHLDELPGRVARGETIIVTKNGAPVAKLTPVSTVAATEDARRAVEEIRAARPKMHLNGLKVKDLIEQGRR